VMHHDELVLRQRQQGVDSTGVVREFHFKTAVRMNLNDRADLTAASITMRRVLAGVAKNPLLGSRNRSATTADESSARIRQCLAG